MEINSMDWITDQIAIGNYIDAIECASDVDAILCLKLNCCDTRTDIDVLCFPMNDGPGNKKENILDAVEYISDVVSSGGKILVHCHAGRSRSVSIVAAYLNKYEGQTINQALSTIASKREIYLSDGIDEVFNCL
jgi:protein-tyrosine phosphatase